MKRAIILSSVLGFVIAGMASCSKTYKSFENGYNDGIYDDTINVDIDTNRFYIDYSKYTQATLFPGLIGGEEPRLENHKVSLDLTYEYVPPSDLRISVAPGAWMSTSMYAPTGELIIIDVPQGVYGLTAQIGPHTDNLTGKDDLKRDPIIYSREQLFPGRNYLRNLYGGLVYIIPTRPLGRIVDLHFTGTALAPSFKLGAMTDEQWHALVEKTTVPWFELEGDRVVFTLETAQLKNNPVSSPTELMQLWDKVIKEAYWDWYGLTENNPNPKHRAPVNKWRIVHDIQPSVGIQHSGYPVVALYRSSFDYFKQAVTIDGVRYQNWGTYHEIGHNMQMGSTWSFSGNGEVTNNLFSFKVSKLFGRQHSKIAEVWPRALVYLNADNKNWNQMESNYSSTHNDIKLIMYAQIFEKFGYEFMTHLAVMARNERFLSANDQSKVDLFYRALSIYAKMDMEIFLSRGWGVFPSQIAKREVKEICDQNGWGRLDRNLWMFNPVTGQGGNDLSYDILDKKDWTISATNADETRPASQLIDNDITKIWHSCFREKCSEGTQTPSTGPAKWDIIIDLKSEQTIHGFTLVQRQDNNMNNHAKSIQLSVSNDGTNYRDLGNYPLQIITSQQLVQLHSDGSTETFRYAKFTIDRDQLNNDRNAALAELGFYRF